MKASGGEVSGCWGGGVVLCQPPRHPTTSSPYCTSLGRAGACVRRLDDTRPNPMMMVFRWLSCSMRRVAVSTSTFMAKNGQVSQGWHLIDAADQVVGRLAVQIA